MSVGKKRERERDVGTEIAGVSRDVEVADGGVGGWFGCGGS